MTGPRRSTLERRVAELERQLSEARRAAQEDAAIRFAEVMQRKHNERWPVVGHFVYILWGKDEDRPVYIGQTEHLLQRLGHHYRNHRDEIVSVQFLECGTRDTMLWMEERLIWVMRPTHNSDWTDGFGEWTTGRRRPPTRLELGWTSEVSDAAD